VMRPGVFEPKVRICSNYRIDNMAAVLLHLNVSLPYR
jgi:hypothetical protein